MERPYRFKLSFENYDIVIESKNIARSIVKRMIKQNREGTVLADDVNFVRRLSLYSKTFDEVATKAWNQPDLNLIYDEMERVAENTWYSWKSYPNF